MNRYIRIIFLLTLLWQAGCNPVSEDTTGINPGTNKVAESNLQVGIAYLQRGEYEKSLEKLTKALEADPSYTPTLNALGLLYQQLGNNQKAEDYFKKALSIRSSDGYTLNNYGQFLCTNNRYAEAQDSFIRAANNPLYETPEIAMANAGSCAMSNNDTVEAEKYFRAALEKNPNIPVALIQMGQISYNKGEYLPARGFLQRYLVTEKHTPKSLWLGIQIEDKLGDRDLLSSYALLLRNNFPDSKEAQLLRESGLR